MLGRARYPCQREIARRQKRTSTNAQGQKGQRDVPPGYKDAPISTCRVERQPKTPLAGGIRGMPKRDGFDLRDQGAMAEATDWARPWCRGETGPGQV